jgi:hypothetical protein
MLTADEEASSLGFSPNGRWLASNSDQGLALWRLQINDLIGLACQNAGRNFSSEEWDLYFPGELYHQTCPEFPSVGQ